MLSHLQGSNIGQLFGQLPDAVLTQVQCAQTGHVSQR